jgi:hypothetical protein
MREQYCSPLMGSIHETAEGLYVADVMDKRTMREFRRLVPDASAVIEAQGDPRPSFARGRQPSGVRPLSERDHGSGEPVGAR